MTPTPVETTTQTPVQVVEDETLPLPKWLTRVYYIFPIVLYIPDAIFNFYVYANGLIDFSNISISQVPLLVLWGFLATGLVGMAWLLSVLAPWHWVRRNYFQSIMCWIGVVIATGITIWNSLAYRAKETTSHFPTDIWFAQTFHVDLSAWSPTTVLVAVAPPFWGLFWAIVQPAERKRSRAAEEADFQTKLERMRQEAELKRMKAEANAQIREAQMRGLAATVRSARQQLADVTSAATGDTATDPERVVDVDAAPVALTAPVVTPIQDKIAAPVDPAARRIPSTPKPLPRGKGLTELVSGIWQEQSGRGMSPTVETIGMAIREAGYLVPDRVSIANALRDLDAARKERRPTANAPRPGSPSFKNAVRNVVRELEANLEDVTPESVARRLNETAANVAPVLQSILAERQTA